MGLSRFLLLLQASLGGSGVFAFGALVVAGEPLLALFPLLVGTGLLAAADRRVRHLESVVYAAYAGPADEEWYADPLGPFGFLTPAE